MWPNVALDSRFGIPHSFSQAVAERKREPQPQPQPYGLRLYENELGVSSHAAAQVRIGLHTLPALRE